MAEKQQESERKSGAKCAEAGSRGARGNMHEIGMKAISQKDTKLPVVSI